MNFDEYDDQHTWDDITDEGYITNHNPEGYNLYGIEVMVHPKYRGMKIGRRLYEARKDLARELNLKSIIIGGRIPNYHKHSAEMSPREYVEQVIHHKIYDPVLSFQLMNGFTLMRINPGYLPDDLASNKYATLMEWNNVDYVRRSKRHFKTSFPVRICVVQYMMKQINSFEEFATQVEYYTDVACDAKADFCVFPEIFTTQLMSFLNEKIPSKAVQRVAEYTEEYIELFTNLAVKYNVNIIGGSTLSKKIMEISLILPIYSAEMEQLKSSTKCILHLMKENGGELAQEIKLKCLIQIAVKLRSKFAMTLNFRSLPVLLPIKVQILFLHHSVRKTVKVICA